METSIYAVHICFCARHVEQWKSFKHAFSFSNASKEVQNKEKQLLQDKEKLEKEIEQADDQLTQTERAWRKIKGFS